MSASVPVLLDDEAFDAQLPRYERERSRQYWTPTHVVAHAVAAFSVHGAKRILDVGAGAGKFCVVAGCLNPELDVHGIEHRPRLVRLGRRLARHFGAPNVRFTVGDATSASWGEYDGFYFFNPFAERFLPESDRLDARANNSPLRFSSELLRAEGHLARARPGTVVVTYHGLGGAIPSTYELVGDDRAGSDRIRTWVQRSLQPATSAWVETRSSVVRVSRNEVHAALASLICGESCANPQPGRPTSVAPLDVYGAIRLPWSAMALRRGRRG